MVNEAGAKTDETCLPHANVLLKVLRFSRESLVGPYRMWTRTFLPDPENHGSLRDILGAAGLLLRIKHRKWCNPCAFCFDQQVLTLYHQTRNDSFLAQRKAQSKGASEETKARKGNERLKDFRVK